MIPLLIQQLLTTAGLQVRLSDSTCRLYRLVEIELYYHHPDHPDPTVHGHPIQRQYGHWHFHRASAREGAGYRGGTFKGMDVTIGRNATSYGGILIRSLYAPEVGLVTGPSKVVDHLLKVTGLDSIDHLVAAGTTCTQLSNPLCLVTVPTLAPEQSIEVGPRIGLNAEKHPRWATLPYRYCRLHRVVGSSGNQLRQLRQLRPAKNEI